MRSFCDPRRRRRSQSSSAYARARSDGAQKNRRRRADGDALEGARRTRDRVGGRGPRRLREGPVARGACARAGFAARSRLGLGRGPSGTVREDEVAVDREDGISELERPRRQEPVHRLPGEGRPEVVLGRPRPDVSSFLAHDRVLLVRRLPLFAQLVRELALHANGHDRRVVHYACARLHGSAVHLGTAAGPSKWARSARRVWAAAPRRSRRRAAARDEAQTGDACTPASQIGYGSLRESPTRADQQSESFRISPVPSRCRQL